MFGLLLGTPLYFSDPESTFVASVCECGAAVRDDGLVLGMTEVGFCTALREPAGGCAAGAGDRDLMVFRGPDVWWTAFFLCWMEKVADSGAAGTGGAGESPFRRECAARPEEWSRRAEPRKRLKNGLLAIF